MSANHAHVIVVRDRYDEDRVSFMVGPFDDLEVARLHRDRLVDKLADQEHGDMDRHLTQCRMSIQRLYQPGDLPSLGSAMTELMVYGWQGWRRGVTREVCAARSKAEVGRLAGEVGPRRLFNLCVTKNREEVELALASPGVVFHRPINEREWTRV